MIIKILKTVILCFIVVYAVTFFGFLWYAQGYQTELDIISSAYRDMNLPAPAWNPETRYFESRVNNSENNVTIYVGYTIFSNEKTSTLEIVEFEDCSVLNMNGKMKYTAESGKRNVIYSEKIFRLYRKGFPWTK